MPSFLDIDLTTGVVTRRPAVPAALWPVLGGRGLNAARLFEELAPDADPLGPDNVLYVTPGLLTGSRAPSASRVHVGARSPLTGLLGSSSVGGEVGRALRSNDIAGLAIRGCASRPVSLEVHHRGAELQPADETWGRETTDAAAALGGPAAAGASRPAMLVIGPAGENLARLACVVTERGHAAGRTGMGAVMGSKRLKAIVVRPAGLAQPEPPAAPETRAAVKHYLERLRATPSFEEFSRYGTTLALTWCSDLGVLATRNFEASQFDGAAAIDGPAVGRYVERTRGCRGCPIGCKAEVRVAAGRFAGLTGERPDFEPLVSWGAKVGIADPEAVMYLHNLCDRLGLDSVSAGAAAAFAVELFERGVIDRSDTGGTELRWGDPSGLETLVREMAACHGFGEQLGGGVRRAARLIGRGAERYAYEVKGLELPAFDPRGAFGAALSFAVGSRGADFTNDYARQEFFITPEEGRRYYGDELAARPTSPAGKAAIVMYAMVASAALDSLGLCKIPALSLLTDYRLEATADLAAAVSGLPLTAAALSEVGRRVVTLERLLNLRWGLTAADDTLPAVFLEEPLADGPNRGTAVELDTMRAELYRLLGWSADGVPTAATLHELGLDTDRDHIMTTDGSDHD